MADETQSPPSTLFGSIKPEPKAAPLAVSSDVLVMMLRMIGAIRTLLLMPAVRTSPGAQEMKAEMMDMERQIAALLRAVDELAERQRGS